MDPEKVLGCLYYLVRFYHTFHLISTILSYADIQLGLQFIHQLWRITSSANLLPLRNSGVGEESGLHMMMF